MSYINRAHLETFLSPAQVVSLASYGFHPSTPATPTQISEKIDMYIQSASSELDTYAFAGGYRTPLQNNDNIKLICTYLTISLLFSSANQPIPEYIGNQISQQYYTLEQYRTKRMPIPGNQANLISSIGGAYTRATENTRKNNFLSINNAKGTFL